MADAGGTSTERHGGPQRELRIAPILTGGTSLAVWIGGVTTELYRVVNCFDDERPADRVYRALLDLTETTALVDVVTGTSAGGLNGVLLSTAWALRAPTAAVVGLRDLWMDLGSIESLLRSPNEKDPPSLLRGDAYFWPQLTQVLDRLGSTGTASVGLDPAHRAPHPRPVDLALTVTTMSGELTRRTDDVGQELAEARLDHTLRFTTPDFGQPSENRGEWSRRLGLAARTSASIPGVFEASYLPVHEPVDGRPAFGDRASFSVGRWAVDGGVLANKPIGAARERIIEQSVGAELRRVALFVNPTPSEGSPNVADDPKQPPTLVEVATSSIAAPHSIGIRHEIDDLRDHNERIRRSVDVGRAIARVVAAAPSDLEVDPVHSMAGALYGQFRHDRAVLSVSSMLDRVGGELTELSFPRRQVEEALVHAARVTTDWLPQELDLGVGSDWRWGIAPIEYGAGLLLELVRRTYRLPTELVGVEHRRRLGEVRASIHATLQALASVRQRDSAFWSEALKRRPKHISQWAQLCYQAWPDADLLDDPTGDNPERASITDELWTLAQAMAKSATELQQVVAELDLPVDDLSVAAEVRDDARAVADLRTLFQVAGSDADNVEAVVQRMVAVHVVAVSLGDTSQRNAEIELVEVSWRADNAIDPTRRPDEKLAGVEFSRLGAFVKRSWRANDWMWGRMDGAAQLVRLLLDPRRLRQLGVLPDNVIDLLEAIDGSELPGRERSEIYEELGFLIPDAQHMIPAPSAIPRTSQAFLLRIQRAIAREELPEVYFSVLRSKEEGAGEGDGGDFRRAFEAATNTATIGELPDDQIDALFRRCRIGAETAASEVGEDMLTRTAGKTALVAANMITGERSGLSWPSRVARPFRQLALLGYVLTRAVTTTSRTGMAVTATLSALAGAIVAMFLLSGSTGVEINSGLVLLALLILTMGLFLAIVRSGVIAALPGFLALLVVALALLGSGMAQVVTGSAERDPDATWRHTVFLGDWPIVTLVLIAASAGWIASAVSRAASAYRLHRIDVRHALARGDDAPGWPIGSMIELVAVALIVPTVLLLHQRWFDTLLVGDDTGWRATLIDISTWLGDRSVVMVLAGLAVFGVFLGLAWDRSFRRVLVWAASRFR